MPAKFFCKTGQLAGAHYEIESNASIGTNSENDIVLYPKIISGKHARITFDQESGRYFIEDLKSRNGTKLDGERIRGKEKLDRLHVITFANSFDFVFQAVAGLGKPSAKTMLDESLLPVPGLADASRQEAQLFGKDVHKTMQQGTFVEMPQIPDAHSQIPDEQETVARSKAPKLSEIEKETKATFQLKFENLDAVFTLKDGENIVGRAIENEICIDDPSISRRHTCLTLESNMVKIKDLGSKNHTSVANEKINSEIEVKDGMEIRFGEVKAILLIKTGK